MQNNEEIIKEFKEKKYGSSPFWGVGEPELWLEMKLKIKDEQWRSKIRSLIPKIGGNARRLLESLLSNKEI